MNLPPIFLASASPRRQALLREAQIEFIPIPSEAPEIQHDQLTAREVSHINAYRKARSVAKKHPDALVLGADTLVHLGGRMYGKPASLEDAYRMLEELSGHTHHVVTAVCLLHLRERRQRLFSEDTAVKFRRLDAVVIRRYLAQVNPLDKAGAYAIQDKGELLIEDIEGSYSNVVGLPIERLRVELLAWERPWPQASVPITAFSAPKATQARPGGMV
jgi:septum formation protein